MPSPTCSREPSSRSLNRSRWMRVSVVALACSVGSLWLWNDVGTADTAWENRGFNRVTGSSVEPAQYVPGEVIVKFRDSASKATVAAAHALAGGQTIKSFAVGVDRFHHLKLGKGENVEDALAKYRQSPAVEYAEPNYIHHVTAIPNDTQFLTSLWGLHNTGQTVKGTVGTADVDIDAPEAWDITTGSSNVIIAVIDTGIAYDHPDLAANMWKNPGEVPNDGIDNDGNGFVDDVLGYDFRSDDNEPMDPVGHGTHVAGTIGAVGNNNSGVTGVMHKVKLMALKAGGADKLLSTAAIAQAINYAIKNGARAINASFGRVGRDADGNLICSPTEYDSLSAANTAGVMVLAAAGNNGTDNDSIPFFPSGYSATPCGPALPNVISVAAITQTGAKAGFSNFGATSVQIAAPGVNTISTKPTDNTVDLLFHNFDSNPAGLGYTFSGTNNSWGFTNTVSFSPSTSMTDSPAGNYLNNTSSVATGPIFSTAGQRGCRLESRLRLATQIDENDSDNIQTDVSNDGGANWFSESDWSGSTGGNFRISTMAELPDRKPNVQYRFAFISDASTVGDGVYVDDVRAFCVSGAPSATTDYQFFQGTSMATPHVTGVVGLLLAVNPNLTVAEIRNAILNTGVPVPALNEKVSTGRRLNAFNALNSITNVTATFDAPADNAATPPGGGGCTIAQAGTSDALMPMLLLMTIGTMMWRGRRRL